MPKAIIAPAPLAKLQAEFLTVLRNAGFDLVFPKEQKQMTEEDMLREMPGIVASLAGSEPYSAKVLDLLPDLKVIARSGVGYDAVDTQACTERGIVVCIAPGTNQDAVSEHTFMLILALAKNLLRQHQNLQAGGWPRQANLPLRGTTLGLVGLGRIGKSMTHRGLAFGMKVIAYEPYPDKAFVEKHGIQLMSFEEVLRNSDWVSLHLPAMPETKHLINKKTIDLMKPTSFLINTARGAVVNESDLHDALKNKRIAGAGLDVFVEEPPGDNPLLKLDNVVLTAHTAGVDLKSRDEMAFVAASAIAKISRGEWPIEWIVNPEVKSKFKWPSS
jgi:D-3-phosphoglycerate dehydrogenase / 2-oxoglutarate reductase